MSLSFGPSLSQHCFILFTTIIFVLILRKQMPPWIRKPTSASNSPTLAVPVPAPHALVSSSQELLTNPNKPSLMMTRWKRDTFLPALPTPLLTVRSRSTWKTIFSKLFKGRVSAPSYLI